MATVLDALVVTLGLDAKEFKHGVGEAKESLEGLVEKAMGLFAVLGAGMELKEFIHQTMEAEISTSRLAQNLGITMEELGKWQGAATLAGGSAEGFNQSIKSMAGALVDIEKGLPRAKRALVVFQAAGIAGLQKGKHADVLEVMDQLSEKMEKMNAFEAGRLGSRIGLDEGTIRLLRKGREGVAELREEMGELGVATQAEGEAALELHYAQVKLSASWNTAGRMVMDLLMPALTWLAGKLLEIGKWAKEHPAIIKAGFIGIAVALGILGAAAAAAMVPLSPLVLAITAIAVAVGLIVAGITWLVLKWKEWNAAGRETESFFGKFFAFITAAWGAIKDAVVQTFMSIWDIIKDYIQVIADEFEFIVAIFSGDGDRIRKAWGKLCDDLGELFKTLRNVIIFAFAFAIGMLYRMWTEWFTWLDKKVETWVRGKSRALIVKIAGEEAGKKYDEGAKQADAIKARSMKEQLAISWADIKSKSVLGKDVMTGNYAAGMKKYEASQKTITTSIGVVNVNAPNATDAKGIAGATQGAFQEHPLVAQAEAH